MLYSGFLLIRVDLRTKVANIQCANPNWLLQLTQTSSCVCLVSQSCTILLDAMDCNLPIYEIVINWQSESENHSIVSNSLQPHDYTVHGILQARILEWVAMPSSRGSSQLGDGTCVFCVSCIAGGFSTCWASCYGLPFNPAVSHGAGLHKA